MQSGFQHFMRSLSTKVTKTYNIDITLIWMQLHVILSNFVRSFTVRNCIHLIYTTTTGPRSAVGNVSGYRCVSDCRSRGREFDPGPVPYFRGD